jgi:hypothetical protein
LAHAGFVGDVGDLRRVRALDRLLPLPETAEREQWALQHVLDLGCVLAGLAVARGASIDDLAEALRDPGDRPPS